MENMKVARTARIVDRILKILQGFLVAGLIVCAVFIPLTVIFGQKIVADASTLNFDCLKITFRGDMADYLDLGKLKLCIIATLLSFMLALAAGWYCIRVLREILVPMKEGRPFVSGISRKLRKLGWTVMISGALVEIGGRLAEIFNLKAYRITEFFTNPVVESVKVGGNTTIFCWSIPAGLLVLFLSFVFRYGEELQQQSDETL